MITPDRSPLFSSCTVILVAIFLCIPVAAAADTISVTYRGLGSYYLGDTIILEGENSFSNQTLIQLSGPGLPAEGVPLFDLEGAAGSASLVPGINGDSWKFAWYTDTVNGISRLQSGRYIITVSDKEYPDKRATISVYLQKPDFYFAVTPNTITSGSYVQLAGIADHGIGSVRFTITDASGSILRTDESLVSSTGYFNKGFRLDLPPGMYTITMSSPVTQSTFQQSLNIEGPKTTPAIPALTAAEGEPDALREPPTVPTTPVAAGNGSINITSNPLGATVFLDAVMLGQTPLLLDPVPAGIHLVEIKAPGYTTYSERVLVKAGDTISVTGDLPKAPASAPLPIFIGIGSLVVTCAFYSILQRQQVSKSR